MEVRRRKTKGVVYTLELLLATTLLLTVLSLYFSLSLERIIFPSYEFKSSALDSYSISLFSSLDRDGTLEKSVVNTTYLEKVFNFTDSTSFGVSVCFFAEIFTFSSFEVGGIPTTSVGKGGCSSPSQNSRVYYRFVHRYENPANGTYVYKFYAWFK